MKTVEKFERAIKFVALALLAFVVGGVFYTLIGFDPPAWFKDSVLYVLTLGD